MEKEKDYKEQFKEKKELNLEIAKLMQVWKDFAKNDVFKLRYTERANKLSSCGSVLDFKVHYRENQELNRKLIYANFCRDRLCPMCAWRLSHKQYTVLREVLKYAEEAYKLKTKNKELKYILLTLTVKNCKGKELGNTIDLLNKAYTNLRKTEEYKAMHLGSFKTVEVTYNNRKDTYHPHLHILVSTDHGYSKHSKRWIKQRDFIKLWGSCLEQANRDIFFSNEFNKRVNAIRYRYHERTESLKQLEKRIREEVKTDLPNIYNSIDYNPSIDVRFIDNIQGSIKEVSKYVVKGTDVTKLKDRRQASIVLKYLADGLHGKRLIEYYGLLKSTKKALDNVNYFDDYITVKDNIEFKKGDKLIREVYKWGIGVKSYELYEVEEITPED